MYISEILTGTEMFRTSLPDDLGPDGTAFVRYDSIMPVDRITQDFIFF